MSQIYNGHATFSQLARLCTGLNPVELVTAKNAKEAKADWLDQARQGQLTNPKLVYRDPFIEKVSIGKDGLDLLVSGLLAYLETNWPVKDQHPYTVEKAVRRLIGDRIGEARAAFSLAAAISTSDPELMTQASRVLYGIPDEVTVKAARQAVENLRRDGLSEEKSETSALNAQAIARHFEALITKLGATGWDCVIEDFSTAIDVRDQDSKIHIPTSRTVTSHKLKKLSGHEVNCHLRGSANARALLKDWIGEDSPLLILVNWLAKSADERIYEGIAKASDVHLEVTYNPHGFSGTNPELPAPWYTLALDYALAGHDFKDTAGYLIKELTSVGYSESQALTKAWTYCYRIFRGSTDTSAAGCVFTKDYAYFSGYYTYEDPKNHVLTQIFRDYSSLGLNFLRDFAPLIQEHPAKYPALADADL